jgi:hypothetical protein
MPESTDKHGRSVKVGARVRLVELSPHFLETLPYDEFEEVSSMVGEVFNVYEIDINGYAWVEKEWSHPDEGQYMSHSLGLEPHQMELVDAHPL